MIDLNGIGKSCDGGQTFAVRDIALSAAENRGLIQTLQPLVNTIGNDTMREANRRLDIEKESPQAAARLLFDIAQPRAPQ